MRRRRRERGDSGASLVELALILPVLALLVFGTIDLVRAYRLNIRLENAAREGAALAQVEPNDVDCPGDANDLADRVALEEPALSQEPGYGVTFSYGPPGGPFSEYGSGLCFSRGDAPVVEPGDHVRVEVEATFDVLTPIVETLVGATILMTSSAEVEVQG